MICTNALRKLFFLCAGCSATALVLPAGDWLEWRGPNSNGTAQGSAPLTWADDKNIAWKATIPGRGHSTPVIAGDRIFVTTAVPVPGQTTSAEPAPPRPPRPPEGGFRKGPDGGAGRRPGGGRSGPGGGSGAGIEHNFVLIAIHRNTGKILWERTAKSATPHEGYHQRYGSFASNSPITDGKLVFAFFGSRGIFCYDVSGNLKWQKDFQPMRMRLQFGEGSAPVLHENALILNFDQEQGSHILVLDKNSGNQLWRADRDEASSWSPPFVIEHKGVKQVILSATNKVRSYDFKTGKLIWECAGLGSNVIPAPVAQNGVVYVMSGHRDPNLMAIELGHNGDLTGTKAVKWTNQRGNSYTASPVLHDNKLYMITDSGQLSCLNVDTGQPHYLQQRLPKPYNFKASPVAADGKLYLATEDGDVVVVKLGETFEVLATNSLTDQSFIASPVILDGVIYLRGQNTLYAIRQ
jgi:outer membrane protein assembly factor BamB